MQPRYSGSPSQSLVVVPVAAHVYFSLLLVLLLTASPVSLAFQPRRSQNTWISRPQQDIRKKTVLQINWFGSKNEAKKESKKGSDGAPLADSSKQSGSLGGVAGIMDSMDSFKNSQRIGKRTGALMQELLMTNVEGVAENGKVKVTFDAQQRPVSTFIDETYFEASDAADVSAAITTAMKDAHTKSRDKMEEKMKSFFNELGLPSN